MSSLVQTGMITSQSCGKILEIVSKARNVFHDFFHHSKQPKFKANVWEINVLQMCKVTKKKFLKTMQAIKTSAKKFNYTPWLINVVVLKCLMFISRIIIRSKASQKRALEMTRKMTRNHPTSNPISLILLLRRHKIVFWCSLDPSGTKIYIELVSLLHV